MLFQYSAKNIDFDGISDDLPFYYGSHPKWDAKVESLNERVESALKKNIAIACGEPLKLKIQTLILYAAEQRLN